MKKENSQTRLGILFIILLFLLGAGGFAYFHYGTQGIQKCQWGQKISSFFSDTKGENNTQKDAWKKCTQYTDFTKNTSTIKQEEIFATLKKTADTKVLQKYACSQNSGWRAHIAGNKNTPIEILNFYTNDEQWVVRNYLGSNPSMTEELAEKISNDSAEQAVFSLARNPKTPEKILQKILDNAPSASVEESLAFNRGTSENFQKILAEKITAVNAIKALKNNPNLFESAAKSLEQRGKLEQAAEEKISEENNNNAVEVKIQ